MKRPRTSVGEWPSYFREAAPAVMASLELKITETGLRQVADALQKKVGDGPRAVSLEPPPRVVHRYPRLVEEARKRSLDFSMFQPGVHYGTAVASGLSLIRRLGFLAWVGLETYEYWRHERWAGRLRQDILYWLELAHNFERQGRSFSGRELFRNPPLTEQAWKDFSPMKDFPLSYYLRHPPVGLPPELITASATEA